MKSISASLVVLSGSVVLAAAALSQGNAQVIVGFIGAAIIVVGLMGWVREWGPPGPPV
jgi:hypothetical protein